MTTEEKFRAAVNVIKNLPKNGSYQPSHDLMLRFYAYFKQATEGPCKASRPAFWEVVKKMKWDAWSRLGNMPREEAMDNYVEELKKIVETMSYTENVASFLGSLGAFYDHVPAEDLELLVGPVIERLRSQPGSPLGGSPFGSRESSPTRGAPNGGGATNGARMLSSLETSPASSYSASPLPPDADDDDEDEEFKDTLEAAPERFVKEAVAPLDVGLTAPAPKRPASNGLANGYANGYANGFEPQMARIPPAPVPTLERGRSVLRTPPAQHRPPAPAAESSVAAVDISEPVAAVVARLQQDLQQVTSRLGSLERAMLARDASNRNQKAGSGGGGSGGGGGGAGGAEAGAGAVVRRGPRWWPIRDLEPRTVLLLAAWPVVVHLVLVWLQRRRRPHFSA